MERERDTEKIETEGSSLPFDHRSFEIGYRHALFHAQEIQQIRERESGGSFRTTFLVFVLGALWMYALLKFGGKE